MTRSGTAAARAQSEAGACPTLGTRPRRGKGRRARQCGTSRSCRTRRGPPCPVTAGMQRWQRSRWRSRTSSGCGTQHLALGTAPAPSLQQQLPR
eukprot:1732984-Rhodomonas_salina.5